MTFALNNTAFSLQFCRKLTLNRNAIYYVHKGSLTQIDLAKILFYEEYDYNAWNEEKEKLHMVLKYYKLNSDALDTLYVISQI